MRHDGSFGKSGHLITTIDRRSRLVALRVAPNKSATIVRKAMIRGLKRHEGHPMRTITTDNGKEFAEYEQLGITLKARTFFAKPYRSWQRGSNENMNGLVRQYFPKGTDFKTITPAALACVGRKPTIVPENFWASRHPGSLLLTQLDLTSPAAFRI